LDMTCPTYKVVLVKSQKGPMSSKQIFIAKIAIKLFNL